MKVHPRKWGHFERYSCVDAGLTNAMGNPLFQELRCLIANATISTCVVHNRRTLAKWQPKSPEKPVENREEIALEITAIRTAVSS